MGAKRIGLTMQRCARLPCPDGARQVFYHDAQVPGLCLGVTRTGARAFFVYRRIKGKPKRYRLGSFPELTVDMARKEAQQANAEIVKGLDPQEAKLAARGEPTLHDLWTHFFEKHAKLHKKTWQEDERQFNAHLARWKNRTLSAIRKVDVQTLHARLGRDNGPYMANRVLATLHAMYAMASDIGWQGPNPATGVKRFKEHKRDRFLQPDEMPRFFKALDEEPSDKIRDYLWVSLLTGSRRGNVLAMRWEELNFDAATWRIPDTKSGEPVIVHLVPAVLDILRRRQENSNGSPWVFPGRGKSQHIIEPKEAWSQLLARANITNLRIHDLRRTFGSYQAAAGFSLPIIGKSLGHKSTSATAVYARLNLDPVRQAVTVATDAILKAGGQQPAQS